MWKRIVSILPIAVFSSALALANPITYVVTVDTSSIAGTMGSFDLNFNPGPLGTQAASLQIQAFTLDGSLSGGPQLTGDVTGALPSILTFDNGSGFNDYFQGITFGSALSFDVSLYGPALSAPDGISTSGSTYAFSMFSDAGGTTPVLTTNTTDGFAFLINVNLDGTTSVIDYSDQTAVAPEVTNTPEPASICLFSAGLAFVLLGSRRKLSNRNGSSRV